MTMECYYSECKYHGNNEGEEGPFCFEEECRASEVELIHFGILRRKYKENLPGFINYENK